MTLTNRNLSLYTKTDVALYQPENESVVKVSDSRHLKLQHSINPIHFWLKRGFDIIVSAILLVLCSPIFLVVAIAIKLDSKGSIFFVQERVGCRSLVINGKRVWEVKTFKMFKFRSMAQNADTTNHRKHIELYLAGESDTTETGETLIKAVMPITRIGKFIRAWSIDELPQLLNVFLGDMTLVGPRPVPTYEAEGYQEWHYERMAALPGITGLWQVKGRCLLSFDDQINLDISYARKQSLWFDLQILFMTIPAILKKVGAA